MCFLEASVWSTCERCLKLEFHDGDADVSWDVLPCSLRGWGIFHAKNYTTLHTINRLTQQKQKHQSGNLQTFCRVTYKTTFLLPRFTKRHLEGLFNSKTWRSTGYPGPTWEDQYVSGMPSSAPNCQKKNLLILLYQPTIAKNTGRPIGFLVLGGMSCFEYSALPRSAGKFGQVIFTPLWVWWCRHIEYHVCDLLKTRPSKSTQWSGRSPKFPKINPCNF